MKKIVFSLMIIVAFAFLSSCSKSTDETFISLLEVELESDVVNMFQAGGYEYIPILSNTNWVVSSSVGWLTVDVADGKGSKSIKIEATANTDEDARNAEVTIKTEDSDITRKVKVTQLGLAPKILLNVSDGVFQAPPLGDECSIIVTASGEWSVGDFTWEPGDIWDDIKEGDEVISEGKIWIRKSLKIGRRQYFELKMNATEVDRSKNIKFYLDGTELEVEVEIYQQFVTKPEIKSIPVEGLLGKTIKITGAPMNIVKEVWFGDVMGEIDPINRSKDFIIVKIPKTAPRGNGIEVKIVYGTESFIADQKIRLVAMPEVYTYNKVAYRSTSNRYINFTGDFFSLVEEIWVGSEIANIEDNRDEGTISVTIPETMDDGFYDVIMRYDGAKETTVGLFQVTSNLVLYAGSFSDSPYAPNTPRLTQSSQSNSGGGRSTVNACDGVLDATSNTNFQNLFSSPTAEKTAWELIFSQPSNSNAGTGATYWQVNSAAVPGELPSSGSAPGGNSAAPWIRVDFSGTTGFGIQDGYITFNKLEFIPREGGNMVQRYTIEISDDGTNWTKILRAQDSEPFPASQAWADRRIHYFTPPVTTKNFRWVVTQTQGGSNTGLRHLGAYLEQ